MLVFAFKWNYAGTNITPNEVLSLVKEALPKIISSTLRTEIDSGTARIICGPHSSSSGKHSHITIHCKNHKVTFHINTNIRDKKWKTGQVTYENSGTKTGHPNDDWNTPTVNSVADLDANY